MATEPGACLAGDDGLVHWRGCSSDTDPSVLLGRDYYGGISRWSASCTVSNSGRPLMSVTGSLDVRDVTCLACLATMHTVWPWQRRRQ